MRQQRETLKDGTVKYTLWIKKEELPTKSTGKIIEQLISARIALDVMNHIKEKEASK